MRKNSVLDIKNHRSAAVRGGRAPGAPPPLDPLVLGRVEFHVVKGKGSDVLNDSY